MKITRFLKSYAGLSLGLCLLGVGVTGCIKDEATATKETTLTLTVSTRSDDKTQNDKGNLADNEQMQTLRVIVARSGSDDIVYNEYEDNIAPDDYYRTFNFAELTINAGGELFDFYAIANEEGFLGTGNHLDGITSVELKQLRERILRNEIRWTGDTPIPQTAILMNKTVKDGVDDDFSMQLEFVVAKVRVNFVNETGERQIIRNIRMEDINPNQGYLFNDEADGVYVPANTTYTNLAIADELIVPAGADDNTASVSAYLYPSDPGRQFVLQASWNNQDYALEDGNDGNITSGNLVSALDRNKLLDITVTLKKSAVATYPDIEWVVAAWGDAAIEVPVFD